MMIKREQKRKKDIELFHSFGLKHNSSKLMRIIPLYIEKLDSDIHFQRVYALRLNLFSFIALYKILQ